MTVVSNSDAMPAQVTAWLRANPSFFETCPDLLAEIQIPHALGGRAVSLVERQVAVLREKNRALELQMAELIRIGQANDSLGDRFQQLTLELLAEPASALPTLLVASLKSLFDVSQAALRVWNRAELGAPWTEPVAATIRGHCEAMENVYCGPRGEHACAQWLPGAGAQTQSIAIMALRAPARDRAAAILQGRRPARTPSFGMLVLGSPDPARFQVGMGTDFLERLADLVGAALAGPGREAAAA